MSFSCSLLPKNIFFNAERTMHLVSRPRDHHRLLGVARCVCKNDVSVVVFIGHASNSLCKLNMFKEQKKKKIKCRFGKDSVNLITIARETR